MSAQDTVRRVTDAVNRHDLAAFSACYAQSAVATDPAYPEPLRGQDAIAKDMSDFFTALPDLQVEVGRLVADGDACAIEMTMTGTHKGPLVLPSGHVPPTNKRVKVPGAIIVRVDGQGRVVDERRYYDVAGILSQLGLLQ